MKLCLNIIAFILIYFAMSTFGASLISVAYAAKKHRKDLSFKLSVSRLPSQADDQPAPPSAKSLRDAFEATLIRTETIDINREIAEQQRELQNQAMGALFPTINGTGSYLRQPEPSGVGQSISPTSQTTLKITGDQPLFRGFREFATLRQKKDLAAAQVFTLLDTARQLFYSLAQAYYNVLEYESDLKNYTRQMNDTVKRLKETEEFYKIGRSQLTDVLAVKTNIATLEVTIANTKGQLESAKDVLAFYTGWNRNTPLKDDEATNRGKNPVEDYLAKIENRTDVKIALANVKANDEGVPIAWGAHLPSLDLLGDYYFERPGTVYQGVNWDASLAITIPIFQGGVIQSQVRQAQSVARQYHLQLSYTRRNAEQEIRTFYDTLVMDREAYDKLTELVEVAKKTYETDVKYYRNGLVTNLQVLTDMATYEGALQQLGHQRFMVQLDTVKLQAATGDRPEINIRTTLTP